MWDWDPVGIRCQFHLVERYPRINWTDGPTKRIIHLIQKYLSIRVLKYFEKTFCQRQDFGGLVLPQKPKRCNSYLSWIRYITAFFAPFFPSISGRRMTRHRHDRCRRVYRNILQYVTALFKWDKYIIRECLAVSLTVGLPTYRWGLPPKTHDILTLNIIDYWE